MAEGGNWFTNLFKSADSAEIEVTPRAESDDVSANDLVQTQLDRPVENRNVSAMENANDAIRIGNAVNHDLQAAAKAEGAATPNNLTAEPVVDKEGRFTGFKVK